MASVAEMRAESLVRAVSGLSLANYPAIYGGFLAMGIPENEIRPRENVFTYRAWQQLGRQVRRGEHGVKVITWIQRSAGENEPANQAGPDDSGQAAKKSRGARFAKSATVFHISQTDPIAAE